MTTPETPRPELKYSEYVLITPDSLLKDNQSSEANRRSDQWEQNRGNKDIWAIVACGDARNMIPRPDKTISIRSIATAGLKNYDIFTSEGVKLTIVTSHIDGETILPGKRPTGCGGLAAKESTLNGIMKNSIQGIQYYINNNISHPDPIVQAFISARGIRDKSGKPSLAVIQDHRTGKVFPFAAFLTDCQLTARELDWMGNESYDELKIYAKGIPELPTARIPDIFTEFLEESQIQAIEMLRKYPLLKEMQKVQNPRMIVISTKLPSLRVRYPQIADTPGIAFKLHMEREKRHETGITITPEMLGDVLNQAEYPIRHSVENFGTDGPFSRTDRVLIETSDIRESRRLAQSLAEQHHTREWLALKDHKIIVIQNIRGVSNIIEEFIPTKRYL